MPHSPVIFIDPERPAREFPFNLVWNHKELQLELSTTGALRVRNSDVLSEPDQAFFRKVVDLATRLESSAHHRQLIQHLQRALLAKTHALSTSTQKLPALTSKGEDRFDHYFASLSTRLPKLFADVVPSMNIFMLLLAVLFLIPTVTDSQASTLGAIAVCTLAFCVQFFQAFIERKVGVAQNRLIQDVFSGVTLSLSSFSSLRILCSIFLNRALELAEHDQDSAAHFTGGIVILVVASLGTVATWFLPSVTVMGPRIQASAIHLERRFLKTKMGADLAFRDKIVNEFKENEGSSLAHRLFCIPKKKRIIESRRDERMINPPSLLTATKRLGGAFVRSAQFSIAFGINPSVLEAILLPLASMGLLHSFVSREFLIKAGRRSLFKIPAMSVKAPTLARGLKWTSEICAVSYNSMINPAIAFYFVFQKIVNLYQVNIETNESFGNLNSIVLLSIAVVLNIPSLILDLSTRRLGIDRFEGWSASRLSYILEESQNLSIRQNLEKYLHLLIESTRHTIKLPETVNPLAAGSMVARRHSRFNQLGVLDTRSKVDMTPRSIELTRLVSLTKTEGKSTEEVVDDEHSSGRATPKIR